MQEQMKLYKLVCKKLIDNGLALEELNNYDNFKDYFSENDFKNIIKTKQNRKNKRYRTKNKFIELYRISFIINNSNKKIVFGTITLNDHYLSLKEDTYIRKIDFWLKKHFVYSILNKDFGSKTEREHYHFIGLTTEELEPKNVKSKTGYEVFELKVKDYEMGFEPTLCLIDLNLNDINKTIEYLLKLNNHSNKLSTKNRTRIIKNHTGEMLILLGGLEPSKAEKKIKKQFYEKLKAYSQNPTYDTLNKRSVSNQDTKEISIQDFIYYLDGNKSYNEL